MSSRGRTTSSPINTYAEALIDHHSMHWGGFACRPIAAFQYNGIELSSSVPHPLTLSGNFACHKDLVMAQGFLLSKACSVIVARFIAAGEWTDPRCRQMRLTLVAPCHFSYRGATRDGSAMTSWCECLQHRQ